MTRAAARGVVLAILVAGMPSRAAEVLLSTPFGGSSTDQAFAVAPASDGRIWVAGTTASVDFPLTPEAAAIDPARGSVVDNFVARVDPDGGRLDFATYLGDAFDFADAAADGTGGVCLTGTARGEDFPLRAEIQGFGGDPFLNEQAFAARIAADGTLVYSTLFRGQRDASGSVFPSVDRGLVVASDGTGACYYAGTTDGYRLTGSAALRFPVTAGSFAGGLADTFAIKLSPTGALVYSHVFGGSASAEDRPFGIAVDAEGAAFVAGASESADFPTTPGSVEPELPASGRGAYLVKITPDGASLAFATFVGPASPLSAEGGVGVDSAGRAVVAVESVPDTWVTTAGAFAEAPFPPVVGSAGVVRLDASGASRDWSTFVAGQIFGLGLDAEGRSLLLATPTANPFGIDSPFPTSGISELSADGSELLFSGAAVGTANDVAPASDGRAVHVAGAAVNEGIQDFLYVNAFDDEIDVGGDAYLMSIALPEPQAPALAAAVLATLAAIRRPPRRRSRT